MTLTNNNSMEVVINMVERETEKAVLVNLPVSWNSNMHARSFWFPKSCVEVHERTMIVATFIIEKMERENTFNGYRMTFETGFVATC